MPAFFKITDRDQIKDYFRQNANHFYTFYGKKLKMVEYKIKKIKMRIKLLMKNNQQNKTKKNPEKKVLNVKTKLEREN